MNPIAPAPRPNEVAVLFLAHEWSDSAAQRFARLRRELGASVDCFLLLQDDQGEVLRTWTAFLHSIGAPAALAAFQADELPAQLGYPYFGGGRIMGNSHFALMRFALQGRHHYYWQIESDVEYRGNWLSFLEAYRDNDADLLASHVHRYDEWPTWDWWRSLKFPPDGKPKRGDLHKAFCPVARYSRPALELIDQAHKDGWSGHFEALVPTVLTAHGKRVQDFLATQACYVGGSQNPCPIVPLQSTMRWRPPISIAEFARRAKGPLLFHPVKENWAFDGKKVVRWPEPPAPAIEPSSEPPPTEPPPGVTPAA